MEPLNKLTDKELNTFKSYVDAYADRQMSADPKYILRLWDEAKAEFLLDLMGNELILSKQVTLRKTQDYLAHELDTSSNFQSTIRYLRKHVKEAVKYDDCVHSTFDFPYEAYHIFLNLCNNDNLIAGKVIRAYSITVKGKTHKIPSGMKISRAIAQFLKIIGAYDEKLYEEFRLNFSRLHNNDTYEGKLCLSIHPFDYITMSDNVNNWSSCMNWHNAGCYRQGTVEMMNSPYVLVAYLSSDSVHLTMPDNTPWNSKKWRQLFIINEDLIAGIKGYPYHDKELENVAITWIRELAFKNLGRTYNDIERGPNDEDNDVNYFDNWHNANCNLYLQFNTHYMYNDFGCAKHAFCFRDTFNPVTRHPEVDYFYVDTPWSSERPIYNYYFCYSGDSECMSCGKIWDYEERDRPETEQYLICTSCTPTRYCEHCGNWYSSENEDWYEDSDGNLICSVCYEGDFVEDIISEQVYPFHDMFEVNVYNKEDTLLQKFFVHCESKRHYLKWTKEEWDKFFTIPTLPECDEDKVIKIYLEELAPTFLKAYARRGWIEGVNNKATRLYSKYHNQFCVSKKFYEAFLKLYPQAKENET